MNVATLTLLLLAGQAGGTKDFPKEMKMKKAVPATVRIVNRNHRTTGTGAILGRDKDGIYVLTAAHLVLHSDLFEVSTFSADSYPHPLKSYGRVEVLDETLDTHRDLVLLRLDTEDRPPAVVPVSPLDQLPKGKFTALSVGCRADAAPRCLLQDVLREKRFRRSPSGIARLWETERGQEPCRSGGPLLNKRGELIGLAIGASEGKGYYCHGAEIRAWLKESEYAFLLDREEKKKKD